MSDFDTKVLYIGQKPKVTRTAKTNAEINVLLQAARRVGAIVATNKKVTAGLNKAHQGPDHRRIANLDRENEVAPPAKIAPSVGKAISAARLECGLTQKEVAQKISEKPSVLQDYESGRAVPSDQILSKLERILAVKLRGSEIGKKLTPPGKKN
ncbi:uncharacterized protein EI90DRAFT_3118943 [Cantharellus anzutake]|uniref:uncharacterized protein n=1 Tax=Cantharellus anzutake TaxID=1750568 RepID=UPI001903694E|nr:uncharacterized protein EI90DRAFT_3118943 [Cantharellus anzutake]KAF8337505.1 hypothetical protein EI90DRAFT_3118943 [Cantharellus anzutake]